MTDDDTCDCCGRTEFDDGNCPNCCGYEFTPGAGECDLCEYYDECAAYGFDEIASQQAVEEMEEI